MLHLTKILGAISFIVLVTFGLALLLDLPFLSDPKEFLADNGAIAATSGVVLLALDILLPIPSSIIMATMGNLFGIAMGALLSYTGMMLSCLLGYGIGRLWGAKWMKSADPEKQKRSIQILEKWGGFALIVTRPIPVLSESVVVLSGIKKMPLKTVFVTCSIGLLPTSIFYALVGAYSTSLRSNIWSFVTVVFLALAFMLVKRSIERKKEVSLQ